jgi:hypothetical protein
MTMANNDRWLERAAEKDGQFAIAYALTKLADAIRTLGKGNRLDRELEEFEARHDAELRSYEGRR